MDIATDPDTGLILDVTDPTDDATPADWIDRAGSTIRYGFYVTVDSDVDVETVTWTETTVLTDGRTNIEEQSASIDDADFVLVDETDTTKTYLVQKNAAADNVSNVEIVRVTGAEVNEIEPDTSITKVTLAENGDITFEGGDTSEIYSAELWKLPDDNAGGNYNKIWTGEYQYGNEDLDIDRTELVAGAYYYVVIDGVESNRIHIVAPGTAGISAD